MESTSFRFSSLFFFFIVAFIAGYSNVIVANECTYRISVQTAAFSYAGTNSRINLILADVNGTTVDIPDLANWGLNGRSFDYFEKGNLDVFIGREICINVCRIIVRSSDSGINPGWKLGYLEIVTRGHQLPVDIRSRSVFQVNQWLARSGKPPYSLSVSSDQCNEVLVAATEPAEAPNSKVDNREKSGPAFDIRRALE